MINSNKILGNILGTKPRHDRVSMNKNKDDVYLEKVGICPKCGKTIDNSIGYWWCKDCGYEESNFERAHNIHK